MKKYVISDGDGSEFRSLRNAKQHIWIAYTQEERVKELKDSSIIQIQDDKVVTITPIIVTADGYSFGRTKRV